METTYDIYKALEQLADMRAQADLIKLHYDLLRNQAIPPEVQEELDEIDGECETAMAACQDGISELESQIKTAVIEQGATVKGAGLMAVYTAGRVSWDDKFLAGYAASHPEILPGRKVGAPSVSIRGAK